MTAEVATEKEVSAEKVATKGLKGVVAADSMICDVDGTLGKLIYRGYNIHDLAKHSTFEETAYLLFQGELPSAQQLKAFNSSLVEHRELEPPILDFLKSLPRNTPPMTALRSAISMCGVYDPLAIYFASGWVFRRELADRVGPWRSPDKIFVVPSQDWLFRAWRSGARLQFLPSVGVVIVSAGARAGSYVSRESPEHEFLAQWFRDDPDYREKILEEAAINEAGKYLGSRRYSSLISLLRRALARPVYALLLKAGIHPQSATMMFTYGGRGGFVRYLRKFTGADGRPGPA